ncbi:MAG: MarR family transcriptional regulator [Magnetospirillum sp.]|nr:MarR family transcriptional regulator [Magnetospirillum sp.]
MQQNLRHTLGYRLGHLARRWRQAVDEALKTLDLTEATWRPLLHLSHLGEAVRQKDLAESMGLDGSSLVRLLDTLEERGLIRREDGRDRRCRLVTLTPDGRRLMERTRQVVAALEEDMLRRLDEGDVAQLVHLLERIHIPQNHRQAP